MAGALAGRRGTKRYAVMPYLGSGTGERQGEMFGQAVEDIDFLRRKVHVVRQVRLIGNVPVYAGVKNDKPHEVPLSESLSTVLAEHIRLYPPVPVTLPWEKPGGEPRTYRLLLSRPGVLPMHRSWFNQSVWRPALQAAGIEVCRRNGTHVLRHTAASAWLAEGVDITAVAEFLGDTVATVALTYAHMMPSAIDRARRAMDSFFTASTPSALDVPSEVSR
jgi:integrase